MIAGQDQAQASNQAHAPNGLRVPVSQLYTSPRRTLLPQPLPGFPALFERLSWYRPRFPIFLLIRASAHLPIAALSPAVLRRHRPTHSHSSTTRAAFKYNESSAPGKRKERRQHLTLLSTIYLLGIELKLLCLPF